LINSIKMMHNKAVLVNEEFPSIIQDLKRRHIPTLVLTYMLSGPYGIIPDLLDWRIETLNNMGLHFNFSFPNLAPTTFPDLPGGNPKRPAAFKDGIVASSTHAKGPTLGAFITYAHLQPDTIIFIDDQRDNIDSVGQYCKTH